VWREGYVPGGDVRFWVRALGHGDDVVVLLHGWPQDGTAWRRVAPLLADAGHRVIAPDLKGFGRTAAPGSGHDPETLADEVSQLIRNLHVRKAVLVGHDWGGAVALATAFRHPGRVRGVVLASSPYRQVDLRRAWHIPLMNLPVLPELAFRAAAVPLLRRAFAHAAVVQEPFTDEVVAHYAEAIRHAPADWLAYYRTLARSAVWDWTVRQARRNLPLVAGPRAPHTLRVPALVLWGEDDPVLPVSLATRAADDLEAEFVTVAGAGHFVPEEDPLAFARAVEGFVRRRCALPDDAAAGA
jgi:pimeloyl-ACP methyl ester carboxylesterase